jgi:hypothetical protein
MRMLTIIVLALVATAAHADRKVYKCTNADGSQVFSPNPCGAGAQEVKVDTSATAEPAPKPEAPAAAAATPAAPAATPDAAAPTYTDVQEIQCRADAEKLRVYPADVNMRMLQQRQRELMGTYAATPTEAARIQIGNLDAAITAEQTRLTDAKQKADRAAANALARCDADKAARDRASANH